MGFKVYAGCLNIQGDGAKHLKYSCSERLILIPLDVTKPEEVDAAYQLVLSSLEDRSRFIIILHMIYRNSSFITEASLSNLYRPNCLCYNKY